MAPTHELPLEDVEAQPAVPDETAAGDRGVFDPAEISSDSESFWSGLRTLSVDVRKAYMELVRPLSPAIPTASTPVGDETESREVETPP
jgi:hypothetical protein